MRPWEECNDEHCQALQKYLRHTQNCHMRVLGGCVQCIRFKDALQSHASTCKELPGKCVVKKCDDIRDYMKKNALPDNRNWRSEHDKLFFEPSPPRTPTVTWPGNLCLLPFEASESASFESDIDENSSTSATTLQNQCHVLRKPDFGSDLFSGVNLMQQQHVQNEEQPSNCSARSSMASLQPSRVEEEHELPASPLSASSMPGVSQDSGVMSIPQEVLWPLNRAHLSVGDDGSYVENSHWKRIVYIGGGSYERCYQCMDLKTGKLFAIKCIREDIFEMTGLEIWGTMSGRHDNILELYGAVKSCGKITIFMEYRSSGSVEEAGLRHEGLALNSFCEILSALQFMHTPALLHGDIKAHQVKFIEQTMSGALRDEVDCDDGEKVSSDISEEKMKVHRRERYLHDIQLETMQGKSSCDKEAIMKEEREEKLSDQHGKISFFCGNPMVEIIKGIIHIYKNNEMTSLSTGDKRSEMICILAVPAKMTCIELMQFVAPSEEFIECVKIIRDSTPNQYMVLVKFRNQELADDFYNTFNGQPYNLIEDEVCHLVYVAKVETIKLSEGGSLPCVGLTELPKCPVCLERMDESVEGILTILCNHSFHGSCLSKWSDTTCPVCRYCQTPQPVDGNKCFECDSNESLWICLICGHIGCGRYLSSHAKRHYQETQHTYSLELGTQRVWDYAGDNFVHRLVQSKTDGKLVEYSSGQEVMDEEKMDSLTLEYTYLLTSQLENQRLYFQEKITQIEKDAAEQVNSMEERSKKTLEECKKLELKLAEAENRKKNIEKKYEQVVSRVGKLASELKDEQELNKCLQENQKVWRQKLRQSEEKVQSLEAAKNQEVTDLQEQLADLMRHLETQQAIASASQETRQELQDGQIIVGEGSSERPQTRKSRRKK